MEDILKAAATQAPGLVVLVFVVTVFLKFMAKRDELIKALTDEHLAERKLQREALERNINALNNVAHVMTETARRNRL